MTKAKGIPLLIGRPHDKAVITAADSVADKRWRRRKTKRHIQAAAGENAPVCEIACEALAV